MAQRRQTGTVEKATRSDLRTRKVSVQSNALAALAVALARQVDGEDDSKARAALARELRAVMVEVAKAAPPAQMKDGVDELRARRQARRRA